MDKSVIVLSKEILVSNGAAIRVLGIVEGLKKSGFSVEHVQIKSSGKFIFNKFSAANVELENLDLDSYQFVYVIGLELANLVSLKRKNIWVLDICDSVISIWWRNSKPNILLMVLGLLSRVKLVRSSRNFDLLSYISTSESFADRLLTVKRQSVVVPNACNLDFQKNLNAVTLSHKIGFVADLGYKPNQVGLKWFLDEIWNSQIAMKWTLLIFGSVEPKMALPEGVTYMGLVFPLRQVYEQVDFTIAPDLVGAGYKNKIGESLNSGKPVLATKLAASGYPEIPSLFVASSRSDFKDHFHVLCQDEVIKELLEKFENPGLSGNWEECLSELLNRIAGTR